MRPLSSPYRPLLRPYFNPRTSCEVRPTNTRKRRNGKYFNPRTSCEVRLREPHLLSVYIIFQSTHLVWGATDEWRGVFIFWRISIHAPRVRCDKFQFMNNSIKIYFNPRTSCEVRPLDRLSIYPEYKFQSTHLVWGATPKKEEVKKDEPKFQSTHLVWGATISES